MFRYLRTETVHQQAKTLKFYHALEFRDSKGKVLSFLPLNDIKNISTYCYTITRLQGYKDRTVFDRSLFRSLLYSPRFVIAGMLSLDDEE